MKSYQKLLLENKAWAKEKVMQDPAFFTRLMHLQTPEFLWIGCSDSRVPANEITGTQPGTKQCAECEDEESLFCPHHFWYPPVKNRKA